MDIVSDETWLIFLADGAVTLLLFGIKTNMCNNFTCTYTSYLMIHKGVVIWWVSSMLRPEVCFTHILAINIVIISNYEVIMSWTPWVVVFGMPKKKRQSNCSTVGTVQSKLYPRRRILNFQW